MPLHPRHPNSLWLRSGACLCPYDLDRKKNDIGGGTPFVFDLFLIGNGYLFYNVSSHVCHVGEQTCIVDEGTISCQCSPTQFVSSCSMVAVSVASPRSSSGLQFWSNSSSKGHQACPLLLRNHSNVVTFSISRWYWLARLFGLGQVTTC